MRPALEAVNLSRRFGGLRAVSDVSLAVDTGALHALIGPNGAGKSTLINLLSGELAPSSGSIRVAGDDVTGRATWHFAHAGIGRSFQRTNVMRTMTVLENLRLAAQAILVPPRFLLRRAAHEPRSLAAAWAALGRVGLDAEAARIAGTLSHGQLRLLEIAIALAGQPKVLLLDEPLAGMGPEESENVAVLLRELARDHAVLLIEHDMDLVFAVADRMTVMVDGRVLDSGTPAHIRRSEAVREAYFGEDA
jgi:branched-chain amino acid transport system ATP-binding protein